MNVLQLKAGESAKVTHIAANEKAKNRLYMLNVYAGAQVTLVRRAPFGGGVMLEAGGVRLALGKNLAEKISVEQERTDG